MALMKVPLFAAQKYERLSCFLSKASENRTSLPQAELNRDAIETPHVSISCAAAKDINPLAVPIFPVGNTFLNDMLYSMNVGM